MQKDPNEIPSYYAVIPANIRYDNDLKPNEKLLYGEITALSQRDGKCWASNGYFSNLYGVGKTCVSLWIKSLKEKGYIDSVVIYKEGTQQILHRYLTLVNDPYLTNLKYPPQKKLKDNNTSNNNTSINNKNNNTNVLLQKKEKKCFKTLVRENFTSDFFEAIKNKYQFENEEIKSSAENFILYWTEKSQNGKKEKWEMEKTFDIKRRFYFWMNNKRRFTTNKKSGILTLD